MLLGNQGGCYSGSCNPQARAKGFSSDQVGRANTKKNYYGVQLRITVSSFCLRNKTCKKISSDAVFQYAVNSLLFLFFPTSVRVKEKHPTRNCWINKSRKFPNPKRANHICKLIQLTWFGHVISNELQSSYNCSLYCSCLFDKQVVTSCFSRQSEKVNELMEMKSPLFGGSMESVQLSGF